MPVNRAPKAEMGQCFFAGSLVGAMCAYAFLKLLSYHSAQREQHNSKEDKHTDESLWSADRPTLHKHMQHNDGRLEIQAIGEVRSVYSLCVGTPRQGLLAPHARGRIDLFMQADAIDGLDEYGYVWIIFIFHLNTLPKRNKIPMKIAPPSLGGKKVGVLATRSPHRPNPIGITLARLDEVVTTNKSVSLHVSGIDLVSGTPVIDIKPFVSVYDTVDNSEKPNMPNWVFGGLHLRRTVEFEEKALRQLHEIVHSNKKLEFYGQLGESNDDALKNIQRCIEEVLSIDVRSRWLTTKTRKGNYKAERAERLKQKQQGLSRHLKKDDDIESSQQLDNLLIRFQVEQSNVKILESSQGSGAEDVVLVTTIEYCGEP